MLTNTTSPVGHLSRPVCSCYTAQSSTSFQAPFIYTGNVGRPRFNVTQHQLQYLRSMSFSWVQISQMLSVSLMTLYRRRQEFGMVGQPNRTITDSELCSIILGFQSDMPSLGQTMVWGRLRSMGFCVTRERVRNALRALDPIETALRWRGEVVHRQPYCVPGPNSLWHLGLLLLNAHIIAESNVRTYICVIYAHCEITLMRI